MDDSQKARGMAYVINEKFESYARSIAQELRREDDWEDVKWLVCPKAPDSDRRGEAGVDHLVERCCSKFLARLTREELRLLWFGTKAADKAKSPGFSRPTYMLELIRELYDRVTSLAVFEEDEGETTPANPSLPVSRTSE